MSRSYTAQKEQELKWFMLAQRLCTDFPRGTPRQPSPPQADIVVPDENLGIEIIEYVRGQNKTGSPERHHETIRAKVVSEAEKQFARKSESQLFVSVGWAPRDAAIEKPLDQLAFQIANKVTALTSNSEQSPIWWTPNYRNSEDTALAENLADIWIYRLKRGSSDWTCAETTMLGNYEYHLQRTIDSKLAKLAGYRRSCSNVWLLIVARGLSGSSIFSPDEDFDCAVFHTPFDRVFLLDIFRRAVLELAVSRS